MRDASVALPVYLDYAATAPLRQEARDAEAAWDELACSVANPNSLHSLGREAARVLDSARSSLAVSLGGGFRPHDLIFCSGGTESNNLALMALAEGARERDAGRTRVILSAIEHDSVLDMAKILRRRGFAVDVAPAGRDGALKLDSFEALLGPDVALVSLMYANNETGVIQPVPEAAALAHRAGALFHTDAVQAFARVPLTLDEVDAVSIAGHKIGAPLGTGALAVRHGVPFAPQGFGGGQESGRRPGTQDVRAAFVFAEVAKACISKMDERRRLVSARAERLYGRLCGPESPIKPTISSQVGEDRLPGIVSLLVGGADSESLVLRLDDAGFEVSAGSACSSASLEPSHVLKAMGIARDEALGALRVSFDERVGEAELDAFAETLLTICSSL